MPETYTPTAWATGSSLTDLTVPSGQVCQVRKLEIDDLIELDILDKVDMLGATVEQDVIEPVKKPADHKKKQATKKQKAEQEQDEQQRLTREILSDSTKLSAMVSVVDKVVWAAVLQPKLSLPYQQKADGSVVKLPPTERDPNAVYTDSISLDDKFHIFDYCFGGIARLQSFRGESAEDVGAVASEPGDQQQAESGDGASPGS